MQIIKPGTEFDFVGKRKVAGIISGIMVACSLLLFFVKGPNWGIDFTGGTEIRLRFHEEVDISELRDGLARLGLSNDTVQEVGGDDKGEFVVRIQDPTFGTEGLREEVEGALHTAFGENWIEESVFDAQVGARFSIRYAGDAVALVEIEQALSGVEGALVQKALDDNTVYVKLPGLPSRIQEEIKGSMNNKSFEVLQVDSVGPKVGGELRRQGFIAIFATLALVLVYVGFRFDLAFAPGAVVALIHDVCIVVGVFVLMGREFNLPIIGALLTIIGYSLNDTIVIYDRIRENMERYRRLDIPKLINDSINQTLARTLATSLTTLMAMTAFLALGGPVIETFALAIFLGVIFGTYSTVYVASPTILLMQDMRPMLEKVFAPMANEMEEEPTAAGPKSEAEKRRQDRRARKDASTQV